MDKMQEYDLPAMGQRQASFYGKAKVRFTDETRTLYSYGVKVASYNNGMFKRHWGGYSVTTLRHVNAFRAFYGPPPSRMGKAEWDALPVED